MKVATAMQQSVLDEKKQTHYIIIGEGEERVTFQTGKLNHDKVADLLKKESGKQTKTGKNE